jgi:lon-related putative ATP-dependent protease
MSHEVVIEKLRRICDPQALNCDSSAELSGTKAIIGQSRAAKSLLFGLGIKSLGFNIYVAGLPGTGRTTMVTRFLEEIARGRPVPPDWCYVNNFHDHSRPKVIRLPPGKATEFQTDVKAMITAAQRDIRAAFESEEYAAKQKATAESFRQQRDEIDARINAQAQASGFLVQASPMGIATIPLKDGQPLTPQAFMALGQKEKDEYERKRKELEAQIEKALWHARTVEKQTEEELKRLGQKVALFAASHPLGMLKEKYKDLPEVMAYLEEVQADILENLDEFRAEPQEQPELASLTQKTSDKTLKRYAVSVLVDNAALKGVPVVTEQNPTYNNLFGRIENEAHFGTLVTDFSMIRQGSLHRANGGYLILPIEELLRNAFSWDSLKRALRTREIVIEDAGERLGFLTTRTLQPQPVPLDVKIILIGRPILHSLLQAYDEDFSELFKVKADFDSSMDRTEESVRDYVSFVSAVCSEEGLRHLDRFALSQIVELGSRLSEDQNKLSARFGELTDVIREADYYATQENSSAVKVTHVRKAIEEKHYRSNLVQQRLGEMISRGVLLIEVEGERVGQVNGLSVINLGDIAFGLPSRITVSIGVGREGLIDIEREAKLSGPTHTKGVLILAGYLMGKFAHDRPLGLSARLVFEQNYSGVDGDSASSTELYAILSGLSGIAIKQGIAVTGSVNQKGEVQAIGGVNEKIEGFFECCKANGFTGGHGVLIPVSNEQHLMLKEEVVDAVRNGSFHVWSVKTIDEGIEILTGVKAGIRREDGTFEEGSINERVDRRLGELAKTLAKFGKGDEENKDAPES